MNHNIFLRLKMAWNAFWLIPFEFEYKPLYPAGYLAKDRAVCDNNRRVSKCENMATTCLSRTVVKMDVRWDMDHYHVCDECTEKYIGKYEEEPFGFGEIGQNVSVDNNDLVYDPKKNNHDSSFL